MRVAIGGASGRLGRKLKQALEERGDQVLSLVRRQASGPDERSWDPTAGTIASPGLSDVDAVVNLSGAGIAAKRWSEDYKKQILVSRISTTQTVVRALQDAAEPRRCKTFLSASAVGIYGFDRGDEVLTEASAPGTGFLAGVCKRWEAASIPASSLGIRVANLRTANVLENGGGFLKALRPLFQFGLGGRIGNGTQWLSWIHIDDHVRAMLFLLDNELSGPVNLASPHPVRNREFVDYYAWTLGRPAKLPFPRALVGVALTKEMVEETIAAGQRAVPHALTENGFEFLYPSIQSALDQLKETARNGE